MSNINPFIEDIKNDNLLWSTQKVNWAIEAIELGVDVKNHPFYEGDPDKRNGNISFEYTLEELKEIKKCAKDIIYFANTYCKVKTKDKGVTVIKLRDYQEKMLLQMASGQMNIILAARQIGKTICSSIFIAWFAIFNYDKNTLILSNKADTTKEILDKGKVILENLPFFLKPGIIKYGVMNQKFDNGCRIIGQGTTKRSGISFTIDLLYLDEFAHVNDNIVDEFYENVYPVVAEADGKIIITSTAGEPGNKYHDLWLAAEAGESDYVPFRVDWWDVPGRDDEWMKKTLKRLGSHAAFNRQFGNDFVSGDSLLLHPGTIKKLRKRAIRFVHKEVAALDAVELDYKHLLWHPDVEPDDIGNEGEYYVFSIDIAEGGGGDHTVVNLFKIEPMPMSNIEKIVQPDSMYNFFRLKQIAIFRHNRQSIEEVAKIVYTLGFNIFDSENIKMVIEWNTYGAEFLLRMGTVFSKQNDFDEEVVVKFFHRIDAKVPKFGLKIKNDNKPIICQNFRSLAVTDSIYFDEWETIEEACNFGKNHNGHYTGMTGHDDAFMTCVNVGEYLKTIDFFEFVDELFDESPIEFQNKVDEILDNDTQGGSLEYDIYELVGAA